jgi:hypothetical protein
VAEALKLRAEVWLKPASVRDNTGLNCWFVFGFNDNGTTDRILMTFMGSRPWASRPVVGAGLPGFVFVYSGLLARRRRQKLI